MEASIILTYRCNYKCHMCNTWKYPSDISQEFKPEIIKKLPKLSFCNVTGGEPFLRKDIEEVIALLKKKANRIVISTNGFFSEKIVDLAKKNKDIGIRVSIEGLSEKNDRLRGMKNGFDQGLRTLLNLKKIGVKDIGFGITVSDENAKDVLDLFDLAKYLNFEFATAVVHNGYYFHAYENKIKDKEEVIKYFKILIKELLSSGNPKDWFRAYFNFGLINYINQEKRLLPCKAGTENFFLDPFGNILPCNAMEEKYWFASMGNLNKDSFKEIWSGDAAKKVREMVENCNKNCWMIGTAAPVMRKHMKEPVKWIIQNKILKNRKN
jgi:radical SAM protein with 4Fe4S-binding SPASM domain